MKKNATKTFLSIALTLSAQAALAELITISNTPDSRGQILSSPPATMAFSTNAVGGFNAYRTLFFTGLEGASASIGYNTNVITKVQRLRAVAFNLPVSAVTYDTTSQSLIQSDLHGTIKVAGPQGQFIFTTGGEIILSKIRVDYTNKTVYATVQGANGIGTQENVAFWTYQSASGGRISSNGKFKVTLNKLQLTQSGFNSWSRSLGFYNFGITSLTTINPNPDGWGNITINLNTTGLASSLGDPNCAIP